MAKSAAAATQSGKTGRNVAWRIVGDVLTLEIDLTGDTEPSGSGKTLILASTQGNKNIGDVHVGLNVYRYAEKKKKGK
jgi:hypothetical protein